MGDRSILPVKLPVTIDIMLNFDGTVMVTGTASERVNRPLLTSIKQQTCRLTWLRLKQILLSNKNTGKSGSIIKPKKDYYFENCWLDSWYQTLYHKEDCRSHHKPPTTFWKQQNLRTSKCEGIPFRIDHWNHVHSERYRLNYHENVCLCFRFLLKTWEQ